MSASWIIPCPIFSLLWLLLLLPLLWPSHIFVAAASIAPEKISTEECSFCADGSSPSLIPPSSFSIAKDITPLTCNDLPTNAITLLNYGIGNSDFVCQTSQLWAYEHCGCPTPPDVRPCWICLDGNTSYNKDIVVPHDQLEGTCDFQAYFTGLRYDHFGRASDVVELKCPHMTWGMDTWCGCPDETVSLPECTLCGNGKTSPEPCRTNPFAEKLHDNNQHAGPNFGTCQYYDWLVERLQEAQCNVYQLHPMLMFDGFNVTSFCCDDDDQELPEGISGVLCEDSTSMVSDRMVPPLQLSCGEIDEYSRYLANETVLVEPWESTAGSLSLRDFCCSSQDDLEWSPASISSSIENHTSCEPIQRVEYERPTTTQESGSSKELRFRFIALMVILPMIMLS